MKKLKIIFIVSFFILSCNHRIQDEKSSNISVKKYCSKGWTVTGYYTPLEKDYKSAQKKIRVKNQGVKSFPKDFLKAVKMEGWGKTQKGWYLGYYGKKWHKSIYPLDADGRRLIIGVAATDRKILSGGSKITIPTLPKYLNKITFTAKDIGGRIKGKHIDIYTGEGFSAERLTYYITGKKHTICVRK